MALLEQGRTIGRVAKEMGVSRQVVKSVKAQPERWDRALVDAIKNKLAGKFYRIANRSIDAITDSKLQSASAAQLILVSATATDKARLIEGQATQRVAYESVADRELQDEIAKLEGELEALKGSAIEVEGSIEPPQATSPDSGPIA